MTNAARKIKQKAVRVNAELKTDLILLWNLKIYEEPLEGSYPKYSGFGMIPSLLTSACELPAAARMAATVQGSFDSAISLALRAELLRSG